MFPLLEEGMMLGILLEGLIFESGEADFNQGVIKECFCCIFLC